MSKTNLFKPQNKNFLRSRGLSASRGSKSSLNFHAQNEIEKDKDDSNISKRSKSVLAFPQNSVYKLESDFVRQRENMNDDIII